MKDGEQKSRPLVKADDRSVKIATVKKELLGSTFVLKAYQVVGSLRLSFNNSS